MRGILIAEDDAVLRTSLARSLGRTCTVHATATAREAIALARAHRPELAFVDLVLGSDDGVELVRELRALLRDMKIVVVTGFGTTDSTVEAMRAGADDVIAKPFTAVELMARAEGRAEPSDRGVPTLARVSWEHVQRVIRACGGNKTLAAERLGIARSTLRRILDEGAPKR